MSTFATQIQQKPEGNGEAIIVSVRASIAQHIVVVSSVPKTVGPVLYTVDGLKQLDADLVARAEMGKEKYGTYLRANNGRSAIVDFYQEILDAIMYAQQGRVEGDEVCSTYVELLINIGQKLASEIVRRRAA